MTEPIPTPTQTRHPWRATLRTVVAILLGLATLLPYVVADANIPTEGAVGQALAVSALVTRIMAIPAVNAWLTQFGLGASPKP